MGAEGDGEQEWVLLASFENRRAAERMVASLGRGFRKMHRKGHATALVMSGNEDGSLSITQSRVVSASGVVYTGDAHLAFGGGRVHGHDLVAAGREGSGPRGPSTWIARRNGSTQGAGDPR